MPPGNRQGDAPADPVRAGGRRYWRALSERAESAEFEEYLRREFPENAWQWEDPAGRREFLRLMGASLALAGLGACTRQPLETIVPGVEAPEGVVPGKPLFYATAVMAGGYALPVLAECHMGRPVKVDGNPSHPAGAGTASDLFAQASILGLYDPDRSRVVLYRGAIGTWNSFLAAVSERRPDWAKRRGAGLRILTGTVTSPTLASGIGALLAALPEARWHQYDPLHGDAALAGARLAFGRDLETRARVGRADVILAIDADFMGSGAARVASGRDFAARRRVRDGSGTMNRLYVVETTFSATGAVADHRFALPPRAILETMRALAAGGRRVEGAPWVAAVAADLRRHPGASLVLAGEGQPAEVHALAHHLNAELGSAGRTLEYIRPVEARPEIHGDSIAALVEAMRADEVDTLVILGGNPAYDAPADLEFARAAERVTLRVHLGLYEDETSALCDWHLPAAHDLETWGDARAPDGTVTILQPLIAPLYGGRTAGEVVAALAGDAVPSAYDLVRAHWRARLGGARGGRAGGTRATRRDGPQGGDDFEAGWRQALHDGFVAGTAEPAVAAGTPRPAAANAGTVGPAADAAVAGGTLIDIVFRPDPSVGDGAHANNGWLQELPKPITRLTWDNAALVGPATARRLGVASEEVVEVALDGRTVRAPVWIVPGHADGAVTLHLGYGRARAGRCGDGAGFNAYLLRTRARPWAAGGASIRATGERHPLACTQEHHSMEGRDLIRAATFEEYGRDPRFAAAVHSRFGAGTGHAEPGTRRLESGTRRSRMAEAHTGGEEAGHDLGPDHIGIVRKWKYEGSAWGMVIDLGACIGCNACVVACQAENNIPIVGKKEVRRGREMHWLRIDRYFEGEPEAAAVHHQPVPCMHCENAPCEVVCPVGATNHSSEGLNQMIYNRCIGTRYCSNNCPYKVRRFNFLQYADLETPSLKMARNPEVTVRTRGVMEKCTYCVQRINAGRVEAEKDGRHLGDGEVVTACQQACPAEAIVFGDLNDPKSRVAALRASNLHYGLLEELNTAPRTTYLARVTNPNPEIAKGSS